MKSSQWCLLVGAFLVARSVSAQTGQFGDFTYESDGSGVTITGYACPGGPMVIPNTIDGLPVTSIGDRAFWNCAGLTSVSIPDSVTSLGDGVFGRCTTLTLKISSGVMSIAGWNLANVGSLAAIEVDPSNPVYSSLDGVLYDKNQTTVLMVPRGKLGSVTVPGSVTSIAYKAFSDCAGLKAVYFLGNVPAHAADAGGTEMARIFRIRGGCRTCMGACRNGVRTGAGNTWAELPSTLKAQLRARTA